MRIGYKVFAAMASSSVVAMLLMLWFTKWTLEQGFLDYLKALDRANHAPMVAALRANFERNGSWEALRDSQRTWDQMAETYANGPTGGERSNDRPPPRRRHGRDRNEGPPPRRGPPPPRHNDRLALFDAQKNLLMGPNLMRRDVDFLEIRSGDRTVGWLGLAARPDLEIRDDLTFVTQQSKKFLLFAMLLLLLAVVVSLLLARHLTQPIRALALTTKQLTQGDLSARAEIRSRDEIGQLTGDFNQMADAMVAGLDRQKMLLAEVAHELRTPLAILRGEIEAIEDGVRELGPRMLRSLRDEVNRLARMVDDLHQLAQWDEQASQLERSALDPLALTRSMIQRHLPMFEEAGLALIDRLPTSRIRVLADGPRLRQVLDNILNNSMRYTDSGGRVEVSATVERDRFLLMVDDSEPAVSEAEASRIFERLYRVERSRSRKFGGSGLGLSICRSIIGAHGGRIWAKPSPLGGLKVLMTLPLEQGDP